MPTWVDVWETLFVEAALPDCVLDAVRVWLAVVVNDDELLSEEVWDCVGDDVGDADRDCVRVAVKLWLLDDESDDERVIEAVGDSVGDPLEVCVSETEGA